MIGISDLKAWLQAEDDDLPQIEELEKRVVIWLESVTGRYWREPAATTEYLSGAGTRQMYLAEAPNASPAPVLSIETSPGVWGAVDASGYEFRGTRLVNNAGTWTAGTDNYRLVHTRGYAPGTEPEDIRQAVIKLVEFEWSNRGGATGIISETVGEYSYKMSEGASIGEVPETVQDVITKYRRPVLQ